MAKLKSLKVKINFKKSYQNNPLTITHNGSDVESIILDVNKVGQKFKFIIKGFVPNESQNIKCTADWQSQSLEIENICSFQMENNQYVKNEQIQNYDTIYFNGELTIEFTKDWCEHNILSGARLEKYVSWKQIDLPMVDTYCVGDSYTYGDGVKENDNWPALLPVPNFNFGVVGISHDGCLQNIKYILDKNPNTKQIICLLPDAARKLLYFDFLDHNGYITISMNQNRNLPKEYLATIEDARALIIDEKKLNNDWINTMHEIINLCKDKNVKCLVSTWSKTLDEHIPKENKLPTFPELELFSERATDGSHPHKKHYEYFAQKILPYVDKYTT